MLQFHSDFHFRFVDLVVFAKSLEVRGQHLHSQWSIGNVIYARLPFRVGLEIHLSLVLFALGLYGMQHHLGVPDGLPIRVTHHHKAQLSGWAFVILSPRQPNQGESDRYRRHYGSKIISFHTKSTLSTKTAAVALPRHGKPRLHLKADQRPNLLLRFLIWRLLVIRSRRVSVARELSSGTLELHFDFEFRLVDLVVFPESLEALCQHLHPQRTVRN